MKRFLVTAMLVAIVAVAGGCSRFVKSVSGAREKAKIETTRQLIANVENALDMYATHIGQYPTEEQGLKALLERPDFDIGEGGDDPSKKWAGPYLKAIPKDAWGNELVYQPSSDMLGGEVPKPYKVFSNGPDGQEDTEDDITNEEVRGEENS